MILFRTTDNNGGRPVAELSESKPTQNDIDCLKQIANKKIKDIKRRGLSGLIIFPPDNSHYKDDINEESIFSLYDKELTTRNLMGFIGVDDTRLTITSRFTNYEKSGDENDYFLHYMLQKVLSINITDFTLFRRNESIWDFLPYLFPYYLKRAVSQGIFKNYQTIKNNDLNIKGTIDIKRHLNINVPFKGKIAYTNRIYSTDNEITQLIRHTIEYINNDKRFSIILKNDKETINAVQGFYAAAKTFKKNDRDRIIAKNLKPARHPYFYKYRELQKLCLLILRHKKLTFGNEKDKIYGLLFDGAWLWEEYLAKIMPDEFIHPRNKTGTCKDWLFEGDIQEIYPDFRSKNKPIIIADAKYKFLNKPGYEKDYGRHDYYQILSYMLRYSSKKGYLLFPYKQENDMPSCNKEYKIKKTDLTDPEIRLTILGLSIPLTQGNFSDFKEQMKKSEKAFIGAFKNNTPCT